MARLMGIPPHEVGHLRHLARKLGRQDFNAAENVGKLPRPKVEPFVEIAFSQKTLITTGLKIQSLGTNIEELGHLVHLAKKATDARKLSRFVGQALRKGRLF